MKKVFLTVLTLGFISSVMVSCQSESKKDSADSTAVIGNDSTKVADSLTAIKVDSLAGLPVIAPTKDEINRAEVNAPDFSNSEVNDGLNEFNSIKADYTSALASKDETAIRTVIDKYNSWVMKTAAYGSKLPANENQKFIEYYEKLAAQWNIVGRQAKQK